MKKTYKRVPFDIELAKKIVSGEVIGRLTCDSKEHAIIGVIELPEETPNPLEPVLREMKNSKWNGYFKGNGSDCGQCLEDAIVKEVETPKHEFKPFDKVLVKGNGNWHPDIFLERRKFHSEEFVYLASRGYCREEECLPYEGNKHLIGTTNNQE